ncbi:helix-turn-helix domain-containing protein [Curtobacterium flaccumfaciens]|uniref:helix-turn-helix domain-containing protein n=1 Tax=Curtobacterium flaccumfaciens TaxID=2035 RepID=UPI003F80E1C7
MDDSQELHSEERERLGRAFKEVREDAGWSVREVAACLRRDPSVVTRIESGKLALTEEHLVNLRRELGVSIDDLIDRSTPPSPFLEREEWSNEQGHWRALTPRGRRDRLFALTMDHQTRAHAWSHAGEEFITVISGAAVVTLDTAQHLIDSTSAALRIAPFARHVVRPSPECEHTELLWTLTEDGVRRHASISGPPQSWSCLSPSDRHPQSDDELTLERPLHPVALGRDRELDAPCSC